MTNCLTCGKERTPPKVYSKANRPIYMAAFEQDEFCSTECAREHYGTSLPLSSNKPREPEWRHGTLSGYTHGNCRCDACTEANTIAQRARRAGRIEGQARASESGRSA